MDRLKYAMMWAGLTFILLLIFLSIYGAFLGSERAESFFNTPALAFYWLAFAVLLAAAITEFRRLLRVPCLLLIHAGCILILAGAMLGSGAGHNLQKQLFGIDKIRKGRMVIFEGRSENRVVSEKDDWVKELPFFVKLKDFQIEYYKPEYLRIQTRDGREWKLPVEINAEYSLDNKLGSVTILRTFENFKITIDGDRKVAIDDPNAGSNPALEVQIKDPNGDIATKYVFERFPGHIHSEDKFLLSYHRVIRDYISRLELIKDGKVIAEKDIEVNHPLHFGGYHFYQHSYDDKAGQYTILQVVSDTGLRLVLAGYIMLCAGIFWHFWLRHIFAKVKSKS